MAEVVLELEIITALAPFRRALRRAGAGLRRDLPWIGLNDPWAIFVSEVMLQQTSTRRVIDPWRRFLDSYRTPEACARAPLADVLRHWSGLGYPRRAKSLHEAARVITERFAGVVPSEPEELLGLPGVGPYTAHAVASFAFDRRVAVLDTNVGRVLARALANRPLRPREAQVLATALLPREGVAAFNQSLLDLGDDPAPRSASVSRPQSAFSGSDRQVRGRIMKALSARPLRTRSLLDVLSDVDVSRVAVLLDDLVNEGLLSRDGDRVGLHGDKRPPH